MQRTIIRYFALHIHFKWANKALYDHEMQKNGSNLKAKLRYALGAGLNREAVHYWDELSGGTGLQPVLQTMTGDPETLIALAEVMKTQRRQIEVLKQQLQAGSAFGDESPKTLSNTPPEQFSSVTPK